MHRAPQEPPEKSEKKPDYLTIAANIASVISVVLAIATGQPLLWVLAVLAAIIAMVFTFVALLKRRWRMALASAGIVAISAIGGSLAYAHNQPHPVPTAAAGSSAGSHAASTTPASTNSATTPATKASSDPKKLFDGEVTLNRNDSVDVDRSPAQIVHDQSGAVGNADLYFDPGGLPGSITAHGGQTVYLPPLGGVDPDTAYATCQDQFDPNSSDHNSHPFGFIGAGDVLCMKTSEGHLAWVDVEANTQPISSQAATSVIMRVIVWAN